MHEVNIIHHFLVIFHYFYSRIILFAMGVVNAGQFWVIMHWLWLDGHP